MEKDYSQNSETGKEYKNHAQILGKGREWKKEIPEIRDWEGNEKIQSHISGTGIRGYNSQE